MWKKILLSLVLVIAILSGLYWFKTHFHYQSITESTSAVTQSQPEKFEEKVYTYIQTDLPKDCKLNSEMACAVEFAVKCTINPDFNSCRQSRLPKFIFMSDESLDRPTEISFEITKIKPISTDLVEIYTDSNCNGNWFGLCQGTVIYVLVPDNDAWRVKDIYAIETHQTM